ncbi:YlqD family protein [Virgibacillus halophilus]|uniref:YlqD family protein n=1 Tax=Tigheibacillus halophilus TaxID=361280 RepID=A0ABU5CAJ0_9BACI|nr:YlqD family protein [Virgibacillus halophilus]
MLSKKVLVKQIITDNSKRKLKRDFHEQILRLEQECQQLLFEQRKLQNKAGTSKQEINARFQQEIRKRKEKMKLVDFKIEQLDMLETGSEITETEVDALVEVKPGTDWNKVMASSAIIVKDDVVIRIDE